MGPTAPQNRPGKTGKPDFGAASYKALIEILGACGGLVESNDHVNFLFAGPERFGGQGFILSLPLNVAAEDVFHRPWGLVIGADEPDKNLVARPEVVRILFIECRVDKDAGRDDELQELALKANRAVLGDELAPDDPIDRCLEFVAGARPGASGLALDLFLELDDPCLVLIDPGVVLELLHGQFMDPLLGVGNVVATIAGAGEDTSLHGLELVSQACDRRTGASGVLGSDLCGEPCLVELALAAQAAANAGLFFSLLADALAECRVGCLRLRSRFLQLVCNPPYHGVFVIVETEKQLLLEQFGLARCSFKAPARPTSVASSVSCSSILP